MCEKTVLLPPVMRTAVLANENKMKVTQEDLPSLTTLNEKWRIRELYEHPFFLGGTFEVHYI